MSKISFSLNSKKSRLKGRSRIKGKVGGRGRGRKIKPNKLFQTQKQKTKKEIVKSIENNKIITNEEAKKPLIIPLRKEARLSEDKKENIENKDLKEKEKERIDPIREREKEKENSKKMDQKQNKIPSTGLISLLMKKKKLLAKEKEKQGQTNKKVSIFKSELQLLPKATSQNDYDTIPIKDFGTALLLGMGWKGKGNAIGRRGNGLKQPIEFIPRPNRLGLGGQIAPQIEDISRKRKINRETNKDPKYFVPQSTMFVNLTKSGKISHVKGIYEKGISYNQAKQKLKKRNLITKKKRMKQIKKENKLEN
ncbi:g-patch domain and kow motifs-containing protein [Anaeramoeba flamelloides]|uniref:G-patch domain and kow motifs-containing protein n=1 Tax=Anaeramoeba flamelloides TaxID=1746091 RepID=A0ABQ8X8K2_9EUKA|nr:g-patch domain and kow motifs-containing protein [Anaeramoeba flamelloides]